MAEIRHDAGRRVPPPDPEELSVSRAGTLYARAVRLRCPACGVGSMRGGWLKRPERCPNCHLRSDRGEEDFFLGAMMFNLVLSEGLLALMMVLVVIALWPAVPWEPLWYSGMVAMVIAPVLFYPFSHTIWLASDILIRPITPEEMEWHRGSDARSFRPQDER
ncbi:MAG TPA: DUF983 domain-containing protein [Longimicrobium sp.]